MSDFEQFLEKIKSIQIAAGKAMGLPKHPPCPHCGALVITARGREALKRMEQAEQEQSFAV